ncbi:hypothetical protein [Psychrobacillus sp. BM2]|uniref:hypothetical protein n=1 Tax=Psychrobacillus sp. BM2 TaxID=3400421 RepID=UPI003B02D4B3
MKSVFVLRLCNMMTSLKIMSDLQIMLRRSVKLVYKVASSIYQQLHSKINYDVLILPSSTGGISYE